MPLNVIVPVSASCSVAIVRMSDDLPAPFGPNSPNIPGRNVERDVVQGPNIVGIGLGNAANFEHVAFLRVRSVRPRANLAVMGCTSHKARRIGVDLEPIVYEGSDSRVERSVAQDTVAHLQSVTLEHIKADCALLCQ